MPLKIKNDQLLYPLSGSFTGSLAGNATSSSYALTASYAMNGGGTPIDTSSFVTISSFNNFTSSYNTGSFTGSFIGSLSGTSSISISSSFANTASFAPLYVLTSNTSSMLAPYLLSSNTSSFILNSQTSSFITTSSFNSFTSSYNSGSFTGSFTGSLSGTSSWSYNSISSSYALTASYATTASFALNGSGIFSGSFSGSIYTDYIDFNTGSVFPGLPGRLKWNDVDGTLDIGLKGGNVTLQVGQEQLARVVNGSGVDLLESDYQVVKITGAQGQRLQVLLAQADNDINSATTLGLVTETILKNQEGFITILGQVKEINTTGNLQGETWIDGDILYVSPFIAGKLTNIKPAAPNHSIIIGYVEYAHAIHGKIFVKVDNGYEIDELHNVYINTGSLTSGQSLVRSGSVWTNSNQLTGSLFGTSSWSNNSISASYALTASYAMNGGGGNVDTGSFATTGSNIFIGDQTISGSLNVTASSFLRRLVVGDTSSYTGAITGSDYYQRSTGTGTVFIVRDISDNILFAAQGSAGSGVFYSTANTIGLGFSAPTARVHVRGTGSTASTTTLRVENSNASASLIALDNGTVYSSGPGFIVSNTVFGSGSMLNPSSSKAATQNVAMGYTVMSANNMTGFDNVGIGFSALQRVTTGYQNMGIGTETLQFLTTGTGNTAVGHSVLRNITTNAGNVGIGYLSLFTLGANQGSSNTAVGANTFYLMRTGSNNIGIGGGSSTFLSGSANIFIGASTHGILTGSGNVVIGNNQTLSSTLNNTIALSDGSGNLRVYINSSGDLGVGTGTNTILGRVHSRGSSATTGNALVVDNSTPITLLTIQNNGQQIINSPIMSLSASGSGYIITQSISQSAVIGAQVYGVNILPVFYSTTASQTETAFRVNATYTGSAAATLGTNIIADFGSTTAGSQLTVTDVTSGSIYMVNDVSGLPIIEATSDWGVKIYDFPRVVLEKTGSNIIITGSLLVTGSITQNGATLTTKNNTGYNVTRFINSASFDNITVAISSSGAPVVSAVSGSVNTFHSTIVTIVGTAISSSVNTGTVYTAGTWSLLTSAAIGSGGDTIVSHIQDQDRGRLYRATFIQTAGPQSGSAVIERLI